MNSELRTVEINKKVTEIVLEHLTQGYQINTATMSGTFGETGRIHFRKGTEIRGLWVTSFSEDWHSGYKLVLGVYKKTTSKVCASPSIQEDDCDIILEIEWED